MSIWPKALLCAVCSVFAAFVLLSSAAADEPRQRTTFTKDILPILQDNCQICHRPGGDNVAGMIAPMSLMTYQEVRPWARSIARSVQSREMPPWFASPEQEGVFENERKLADDEIATIVEWTRTGAPRGRVEDAPEPLDFPESDGWLTGKPDVIVTMTEPYFVPDDLDDQYINFVTEPLTEELLPEDRWLRAIEWRGGSEVVHHIVGAASVEGADGEVQRFELGSIAPGEEGTLFPPGYGKLLRKGSRIHFNMHYHKEAGPGTGTWDQSMVGFRFWDPATDPPIIHPVRRNGITNAIFEIPPGHPNWEVGAARTFEKATTILTLHPHMHLRGKAAKYVAIYPDGTRDTLIDIPRFDFNWQLDYSFKEPLDVPAGTRVEFTAYYDNSVDNVFNPDPTIPMGWGGPTTMEMMIGYVSYCDTEPVQIPAESSSRNR